MEIVANSKLSKEELQKIRKKTETDTLKRIEDLIYSISNEMSFYSAILSILKKKISYDIPIAAVGFEYNNPTLYLNPDGLAPFTSREIAFIFVHEIMHISLFHHLRGNHRDLNLFNVAADLEINQKIESNATKTPSIVLLPEKFDLPEDLGAEDYYKILNERGEELELDDELLKEILDNFRDSMKPECTCENEDNDQGDDSSTDENREGGGEDSRNSKKGANSSPETSEEIGEGSCPKCSGQDGNDPNYDENSIANDFRDLHPKWGEKGEGGDEKKLIEGLMREVAKKHSGSIPGELEEIIKELFKPQINWRRQLSAFKSSVTSSSRRRTWGRPNRRHGMLLPGKLKNKTCNLLVAIDTSASLCTEELAQFLAEIDTLSKEDVQITLVQCDTKIQEVVDFDDVDINNFNIKGRGGTSFIPVFDLLDGNTSEDGWRLSSKPDGLIYLTDGGGVAPDRSGTRVLWVLSEYGHKPLSSSGGHISYGNFTTINVERK